MSVARRVLAVILAGIGGLFAALSLYPLLRGQQWGDWAQTIVWLVVGAGLLVLLWRAARLRALLARAAFAFAALWLLLPLGGWFYNPENETGFAIIGVLAAAMLVGAGLALRRSGRP